MIGFYAHMMHQSTRELEDSMPESLAMMVSFLLRQLRAVNRKEEEARGEISRLNSALLVKTEQVSRAEAREVELRAKLEKEACDKAVGLRNANEAANKEIQRLTKELLELKEAAKPAGKRSKK